MKDKVEILTSRRNRAVADMQQWRGLLDKVYDYASPNKNAYKDSGDHGELVSKHSQGQNLTHRLYDLTLTIATKNFVSKLSSALIPRSEQWLKFVPGQAISDKFKDQVAEDLQGLTNFFFNIIDNSNFYLAVPEAFEECAISTGVIQINEGDDDEPIVFNSVPINSIAFETGIDGSFKGYFRDFDGITVEEILAYWPDSIITNEITQLDRDARSSKDSSLHVVEATIYNYKTKQWDTSIFELKTQHMLFEMQEEYPAFVAFRWSRRAGESLGRGPALDAMPAAASINEAMRDELISAAFKARPTYIGFTDAAINWDTVVLTPGSIIPVMPTMSGGAPLSPLPSSGDVNFGVLVVQDLRDQINKLLFTGPLGAIDSPVRTATESAIRAQDFAESQGAAYNRVFREFFQPMVKRIIYLFKKRGDWPVIKDENKKIAVKFETPISVSRGQKEVEKFILFFQALAGMIGQENAAAVVDIRKLPSFLAEHLDAELSLVSSEKVIKEKEEKVAGALREAEQQQTEQQQAEQGVI